MFDVKFREFPFFSAAFFIELQGEKRSASKTNTHVVCGCTLALLTRVWAVIVIAGSNWLSPVVTNFYFYACRNRKQASLYLTSVCNYGISSLNRLKIDHCCLINDKWKAVVLNKRTVHPENKLLCVNYHTRWKLLLSSTAASARNTQNTFQVLTLLLLRSHKKNWSLKYFCFLSATRWRHSACIRIHWVAERMKKYSRLKRRRC